MRTLRPQLASLLLLGMALAQQQVTVQEGPLYRTEGSHITLWCKVSGYQGSAEQNFHWSIYLPSAPEREVQIVSTIDPSFPYAIYTQRVRSRGIYVERVQGDAVLLHITELQDRDAGEYECHTPNTQERYFGSYSAKMNLVGLRGFSWAQWDYYKSERSLQLILLRFSRFSYQFQKRRAVVTLGIGKAVPVGEKSPFKPHASCFFMLSLQQALLMADASGAGCVCTHPEVILALREPPSGCLLPGSVHSPWSISEDVNGMGLAAPLALAINKRHF